VSQIRDSGETEYAGELVIEWPDQRGEYRRPIAGTFTTLYEFRFGYGLELLSDVVAMELHADAVSWMTADLTRDRPTGDPDAPYAREVSRWIVAGFRLRPA
jgi:hypothetical protein